MYVHMRTCGDLCSLAQLSTHQFQSIWVEQNPKFRSKLRIHMLTLFSLKEDLAGGKILVFAATFWLSDWQCFCISFALVRVKGSARSIRLTNRSLLVCPFCREISETYKWICPHWISVSILHLTQRYIVVVVFYMRFSLLSTHIVQLVLSNIANMANAAHLLLHNTLQPLC